MKELCQISCRVCRSHACGRREDLQRDIDDCDEEPCEGKILGESQIEKPDYPLDWADRELENANWHRQTGLPARLFKALDPFVAEEDKVRVAVAIAKTVYEQI
jgi:hypothetical protein